MKRAELESKLEGVENAKEIIDFIMAQNGTDVNIAKQGLATAQQERDALKVELEKYAEFTPERIEAFKKYDPDKVKELEEFKNMTEQEKAKAKKESALTEILKEAKFSEKAIKLLIRGIDVNAVELAEDGTVKNSDKVIEPLKAEYAEYLVKDEVDGAESGKPKPNTETDGATDLKSAIAEALRK